MTQVNIYHTLANNCNGISSEHLKIHQVYSALYLLKALFSLTSDVGNVFLLSNTKNASQPIAAEQSLYLKASLV